MSSCRIGDTVLDGPSTCPVNVEPGTGCGDCADWLGDGSDRVDDLMFIILGFQSPRLHCRLRCQAFLEMGGMPWLDAHAIPRAMHSHFGR